MGTAVGTTVSTSPGGGRTTEGYLSQPMLVAMAGGAPSHWTLLVTVNGERLTLMRGELMPGIYGEGYFDRRHPHTVLHEGIVSYRRSLKQHQLSLTAGKGFVPFGSDDPMNRPLHRYPVNHHLSQVLERGVVIAGVRRQWLMLEGALFNGDEPESPSDSPNLDRFGDSWAGRLTLLRGSWEWSTSLARIASPEDATGFAPNHRKLHAALRYQNRDHPSRQGLVEFARTTEYQKSRRLFEANSLLAEGSHDAGRWRVAARVERTDRLEEERTSNLYRTTRPLLDFNIIGKTRWSLVTLRVDRPAMTGGVSWAPFAEATVAQPSQRQRNSAFDPAGFYGERRFSSVSLGVRLHAGVMPARMGRYGVSASPVASHLHQ